MSGEMAGASLIFVGVCLNLMAMWLGFRDRDRRERALGQRSLRVRYPPLARVLTALAAVAVLVGITLEALG